MKIGLVDGDNWKHLDNCFPNLSLMKLSAYCKNLGHTVEWCRPGIEYDYVLISKVFSHSSEPTFRINSKNVIRGGTGYCINTIDGKEVFDKSKNLNLPFQIEHIYPDYSLYNIEDTAHGFMSRGCPRGCDFCHVKDKEGTISYKVADLNEFWNGQRYIELYDPNTFACSEWEDILDQLIASRAYIDFNQGVDIRVMTPKKIEKLLQCRIKRIHFAWDRYEDKEIVAPKLKAFRELTNWERSRVTVYILTNFNTTLEEDLKRVMFCRSLDFQPYIMRYDKANIKRGSDINKLARWVNFPPLFWKYKTFEEYKKEMKK